MAPVVHPASNLQNLKNDNAALNEQTRISPVADLGEPGVYGVICPSFAASAQGDFFVVQTNGPFNLAVWLDRDANGTEPSGPLYLASDAKVQVDIVTGDTAAQVAVKVKAALDASEEWPGTIATDGATLLLTKTLVGPIGEPSMYDAAESTDGSFVASISHQGVDSVLGSLIFFLFDGEGTKYHCWMNPSSVGSDPDPGDSIPIEVAFAAGSSAAVIAAAMQSAIDALPSFEANLVGTSEVQVRNRVNGQATDASDQDTGFTVTKIRDGETAPSMNIILSPSESPSQISNVPSIL